MARGRLRGIMRGSSRRTGKDQSAYYTFDIQRVKSFWGIEKIPYFAAQKNSFGGEKTFFSISRPSSNLAYCILVSMRTSLAFLGHWYLYPVSTL